MSDTTREIMEMVDMLPEPDQQLVSELVKKLVLAWDPDFTKLTPAERAELEEAEAGEHFGADAINWK